MEAGVGRQSLEFFLASDNMVADAFVGCPWFWGGADLHAHHLSLSHHSFPEYMLQSRPPRFRGRPGYCTSQQKWTPGSRSIAISKSDITSQLNENKTFCLKIQSLLSFRNGEANRSGVDCHHFNKQSWKNLTSTCKNLFKNESRHRAYTLHKN